MRDRGLIPIWPNGLLLMPAGLGWGVFDFVRTQVEWSGRTRLGGGVSLSTVCRYLAQGFAFTRSQLASDEKSTRRGIW